MEWMNNIYLMEYKFLHNYLHKILQYNYYCIQMQLFVCYNTQTANAM